jgi:signal peptidase II
VTPPPGRSVTPPARPARRARLAWLAGLLVSAGASQLAGAVVGPSLPLGREHVVVPHVLSLTVVHNTGVAFGLLSGLGPAPVVALAVAVLGVLLYNSAAWSATAAGQWGLGLMLGGALGNVVERVRFGYVLDYLDLHVWPVFNLADTAVVAGAGLLLLALSRSRAAGR